ncbi:extracellular solute-binding protein [Cohnella lubricantis]|uniref:Extracellular solute-binding protein n=1 Tax=Cohnella lubricantis TaxID=2163172 RepID=A0A841T8T0_9BACL|nr:extracellular solute-binding protein [Cohnella lubricantis]MBB6677913.1 extracellular solute-binding protein [Cohnella lubricantis]MBP2120318.1 raffinose/stachyose/melibiose transport system substrate-binding protein [Cohnella lubricantis]
MSKPISKSLASAIALMVAVPVALTACGGNNNNSNSGAAATNSAAASNGSGESVTLRFFSNLPDRKSGQGLIEQTVIDNYVKENPNVKIEVEALAEEPFKNKLKAYMASNEPVDVTMVHFGAELGTLVSAGWIEELNPADYEGETYNFLPGVFKGFTFNDKLYGLPRNSDYEVIYYNKKLFADNGIKVPTTLDELFEASKAFRDKGIEPMSMNGKDLWSMAVMYQNIAQRLSGDQNSILDATAGTKKFADDANLLEAAKILKRFADEKVFNTAYMTMDYGASQNLFTQGKAAMWYMGSWEAGMASNESLPQEFRDNLGVIQFPTITGGKGIADDLIAWNGGGYALVKASKHPEEAKKFFDYMMRADQWAKIAWDTGAAVPAQKYELTGNETEVQKQLTDILLNAASTSGMTFNDAGTAAFKDASQNAVGKLLTSGSPEKFIEELQAAADKQ